MTIGVTGSDGKIGKYLLAMGCVALECDVTKPREVKRALRKVKPDVIIHLAAITDVDLCEKSPTMATDVNLWGTARVRMEYNGPIIYVSTDHLFDGRKGRYTERSKPNPVNMYGYSKMGGEATLEANPHELDTIVRTSKLFTNSLGDKFLDIHTKLQREEQFELSAVIYRTFLYGRHFAQSLIYLVKNLNSLPRLINISGTKFDNLYNFGVAAADVFGFDSGLIMPRKVRVDELTPRPYKGGLNVNLARKNGFPMYSYIEGLEALKEDAEA